MKVSVAIAAVLALATLASADDKKYTLADLKALVAQKSYREAAEHLGDVAPAERKADWQDVAGEVAAAMVGSAPLGTQLAAMQGFEQLYPTILKSAKYIAVRTDVAPPAFAACFQGTDFEACRDAALKFVDADPTNAKLTLAIAKVARLNMNSYVSVPFFKRALAATKGGGVCKDDDLSIAVLAALGLPYTDPLFVDARPIAMTTCWAVLKKAILKELADNDEGYYKENVCDMMRGKPLKETGDLTKLCAAKE